MSKKTSKAVVKARAKTRQAERKSEQRATEKEVDLAKVQQRIVPDAWAASIRAKPIGYAPETAYERYKIANAIIIEKRRQKQLTKLELELAQKSMRKRFADELASTLAVEMESRYGKARHTLTLQKWMESNLETYFGRYEFLKTDDAAHVAYSLKELIKGDIPIEEIYTLFNKKLEKTFGVMKLKQKGNLLY
ncbi:MAG: hypothetical protein NUV57_00920 [archaeon]|nr:hypothetical protein [archaeon]